MNLPRDSRSRRLGLVFVLAAVSALILGPAVGVGGAGIAALVLAPLSLAAGFLLVRRLPRILISGVIGGAFSGFVAGGIGGRLAMRIVALMGGRTQISAGGTFGLFLLMAMLGAVAGLALAVILELRQFRARTVGATLLVLVIPLLLGGGRNSELLTEGQPIANLIMFPALAGLFGYLAVRTIRWVESRLPGRRTP